MTKVKVHATKVNPGDILFLPWGWIVCESVVNNEPNIGLRFPDFNASTSDGIESLVQTVAPKPDDIKPMTSIWLLKKILEKTKEFFTEGKGKGKGRTESKAKVAKKDESKAEPEKPATPKSAETKSEETRGEAAKIEESKATEKLAGQKRAAGAPASASGAEKKPRAR